MSKNNLPSVTSNIPKDLRYFIDRVRETLNQSGKNRFVTVSDLKDVGVIDVTPGGDPRPPADEDNNIIPVLKPPVPTGLEATGGYEFITLTWDTPSYYGHGYTEVYRVTGDTMDFTDEELVATVTGFTSIFSDYVGTGQTFSYRIRFVNIMDVQGDPSDPVTASTALDVEELLEVLTGNISNTQLNHELAGSLFGEDGFEGRITEVRDDVNGLYVLKVAADGKVAGFGLSIEEGEAFFAVQADRFWLSPPPDYVSGGNPSSWQGSNGQVWYNSATKVYYLKVNGTWEVFESPFPFIVQTTPVTIDDVDVPPGVYINDAYIKNATITTAMIKTAAIDTARIVNGAVTNAKIGFLDAGKIVTGRLQSPNFDNTAGRAGFLLSMGVGATDFTPTLDAEGNIQFDDDGNIIGTFDGYRQEDATLILRSKLLTEPALQLLDGTVTINALAIRRALRSVSWTEQPNRFGFEIDVDNGTVKFRDGTGDNVFEIADGNSKGVVKMTGAAIRDYIQSVGFNYQSPGFRLDTGLSYAGLHTHPSFYLYGTGGALLLGVDSNGTRLGERLDNSFVTQTTVQGSVVPNPLMFEKDFSLGTAKPRGWFLSGTTNPDCIYYSDTPNSSELVLDKSVDAGVSTAALGSTAFKVDPNVKTYRVKVRWKAIGALLNNAGFFIRMATSNTDLTSQQAIVQSATNSPYPAGSLKAPDGYPNLTIVSDTNLPSSSVGSRYTNVDIRSNRIWHTTVLEWRDPPANAAYASLSILNWLGLGDSARIVVDYALVEPYEYKSDAIVGPDNAKLGLFSWVQDRMTANNIRTYLADAAIVTAVIGDAQVKTLKIGENAVTVPDGETGPCSLNVGTAWTSLHSPMYVQHWDSSSVPQAVLVTAQAQFMGTLHGSTSGERRGSGFVRVRVEWRTSTGGWSVGGNQLPSESMRFSSFLDGYSGLTTSVTHFNVPHWSRGARFTVEARFEPWGSGYETRRRGVSSYSITVLGAKR